MFKNDAKVVLYKYCFCSDYWEKYEVQVSKGLHGERILFAGAVNGNKIYLLTNKSEIIMFELVNETNKCNLKIIKNLIKNYDEDAAGATIFIEDEFHYISISTGHLIYYYLKLQNQCHKHMSLLSYHNY